MTRRTTLLAALGCALATLSLAQAPTTTSTHMPASPAVAPAAAGAPATGFRAEYIAEVDSVGKKIVELAEAIPADKYAWRPAEGVRSIGEAFMHIVAGTSSIPTFVGGKRLEGITRDSEKTITDKAKIVELLKRGIENAKETGRIVPDADLDKKVKVFGGREMTERQVLVLILNHLHEHLGQEIAYARVNGIAPPWSKSE
jgi:uncharacterized damage-inducible protein DinB